MSYLDVIPLADVKIYLRIDEDQNDTDAELISMINSACRFVESHTNYIFYDRNIDYDVVDGERRVYDHPINSVVTPATSDEYEVEKKRLYKNYTIYDTDVETLTLNVGYINADDVPSDLIELVKVIVDVMYNDSEDNKSFREMLPGWANEMLNSNRRFIF
jgi:hypothetical protein